jgi:hypothetical protein
MGDYGDTLKDIEGAFGFVPGFMKAVPKDLLVKEWPLMKKYQLGESLIPQEYREFVGLAIAANPKCHTAP